MKYQVSFRDYPGEKHVEIYALEKGLVVGSITVQDWHKDISWISWLYVRPEFRRGLIASTLINEVKILAVQEKKRSMCLFVKKNNSEAIALYEKLGFVYGYSSDNDYWAMALPLRTPLCPVE